MVRKAKKERTNPLTPVPVYSVQCPMFNTTYSDSALEQTPPGSKGRTRGSHVELHSHVRYWNMQRHQKQCHDAHYLYHQCPVCEVTFTRRENLVRHKQRYNY